MIKNWTVVTQPVRNGIDGLIARERYLTSKSHPNHKNTSSIKSIVGNKSTVRYISLLGERYKLNQKLSGKRGRHLSSYAMEYCLTLPKGINATDSQWREIIKYCCRSLARFCKLNDKDLVLFERNIRAVLHRQDQSIKSGTGDHVHLIIGKILNSSQPSVLKELQKKKATQIIKSSFNIAVTKHLGISYKDYTPSELNKTNKMEIWKHHFYNNKKAIDSSKTLVKLQKQIDKWFESYNGSNTKQMNRQFNRIKKSYLELVEINTCPENLDLLNRKISTIETLSKKKIS